MEPAAASQVKLTEFPSIGRFVDDVTAAPDILSVGQKYENKKESNSAIYKYHHCKQLYVLFLFAPLFYIFSSFFVQSINVFKPTQHSYS